MLSNLNIVLVETRFPENIGAVARASANYGSAPLHLVQPERWDKEKALPLATKQGKELLENIKIHENVQKAVAKSTLCIGTTARMGGWRREILSPRACAEEIVKHLAEGEEVSILFGPEDRGLENSHLEQCQDLVCIPTAATCSSLNIAQAVLLIMYEIFLALPKDFQAQKHKDKGALSRRINNEERQIMHEKFKETLMQIDALQKDNPDYFFLPIARFLDRSDIRRHEMDIFMGVCRQIKNLCIKKD